VVRVVGRIDYVVEVVVVVDGEFGYVAKVVVVGWRWVDAAFGRVEVRAFVIVGEGC
jgi:hypothetical protein